MSDLLGIDKAIRNINPRPFYIWSELSYAIDRDKDMKDFMLWAQWAFHAIGGMNKVNLEELQKLTGKIS